LRLAAAGATLEQLSQEGFQPVIDDPRTPRNATRMLLVSGKLYWELLGAVGESGPDATAILRVEQLYPFPTQRVADLLSLYPNLQQIVWVQEEPKNQGMWKWASSRIADVLPANLRLQYCGRPRRASPAEGFHSDHEREQQRIIREALAHD
jgi:2-oxoglutarate dehydrogenase E1 component